VVTAPDALSQQVIFVGGAVVELYATDEGAAPVRPTFDVDCLVRVNPRQPYLLSLPQGGYHVLAK
jgi:hypothetical protein